MKIAIVVQGRFHAFDLARALLRRGHDVTVFTSYPARLAARFGLPSHAVRSYVPHFLADRAVGATASAWLSEQWEPISHKAFGRWAAGQLARQRWDVVHCWSGVSEELLESSTGRRTFTLLMRGSSHIHVQRRLLDEESTRVAADLDRPSEWMMARELREYELASRIVVLSTFAAETFTSECVSNNRLALLPLGVDVTAFLAKSHAVAARQQRIRSDQPLTVAYAGTVSFRKGFWDLAQVIRTVSPSDCRFVLAGSVLPECEGLLASLGSRVEWVGALSQKRLPAFYQRGDLFVFPTLEDGFGLVLAQAKAAGLPILATTNCAARDFLRDGEDGWILPIRDAGAFAARLAWCHRNRERLASMAGRVSTLQHTKDWAHVAADFESICAAAGVPTHVRGARHQTA